MRYTAGKKQVLKPVSVNDEDVSAFKYMQEAGVKVVVQQVPEQSPIDLFKYL